jgi:hypothetical protein
MEPTDPKGEIIRSEVRGSLRAMPPTEILQWLGGARKTGTLEVEHGRVVRRIHFRDGVIRSCGSDYAPTLLGQYLLSRGRIEESELRAALAQQEGTGRALGEILIEAGRLTVEEFERFVAAKVEETIYGLFDLDDGVFRFRPGGESPADIVEVEIAVEHVLLQGAKREDDMRRLREFIPSDDVVLERTGAALPSAVAASSASMGILGLVDGRRTVQEIVLHAHASQFLAQRLLAGLVRNDVLRVTNRSATVVPRPPIGEKVPHARVEAEVRQRLQAEDPEGALRILEEAGAVDPEDWALRELRDDAESACFAQLFGRVLGPRRVPKVVRAPLSCSAEESFLLSLVDGKNDVRALVWLAPMRALAVVRALKGLVDAGVVELKDPA